MSILYRKNKELYFKDNKMTNSIFNIIIENNNNNEEERFSCGGCGL